MKPALELELSGTSLTVETFRRDVLRGLSQPMKSLPAKYFYDEEGARLFEAICELDEYFPTRTEFGILRDNIDEIVSLLGPDCQLVDLGSGNSSKTRLLLDHLERPASYIPIDVAQAQLLATTAAIVRDYPALDVLPVCADFTAPLLLPGWYRESDRTVLFFPGSTIGNFEPAQAELLLRRLAGMGGPDARLLIGLDLQKDAAILHQAYNDSQGLTARFNLNLLTRVNRELGADFNPACFRHRAFYNTHDRRVEMHLVSQRPQMVSVAGTDFLFARGESIRTEYSYKYSIDTFQSLAARAGLEVAAGWTDERHWFSVQLLVRNQSRRRG